MSEKKWNQETNNWEIDGVPVTSVTYRVTWKIIDDGDEHEREFADVDQGYDFYQNMKKSPNSYAVTWDHIYRNLSL
jgi:hypothetical protein